MLRCTTRPALALLSALALLGLAACVPTASEPVGVPAGIVRRAPTATPTETPSRVPAPTPTNVPAGWKVLATNHFSLAYPPDWTAQNVFTGQYAIETPAQQVRVDVSALPKADLSPYCRLASPAARQTTLAGLPMKYLLAPAPRGTVGKPVRAWVFANAQQTDYVLRAFDFDAGAATQAQDEAILATFRPDNADPWQC